MFALRTLLWIVFKYQLSDCSCGGLLSCAVKKNVMGDGVLWVCRPFAFHLLSKRKWDTHRLTTNLRCDGL